MACFDNFITVEETCSQVEPASGYSLNQIGISKNEIEQIITRDYTSVDDFVAKKSAFAINKVVNEIYNHLSPRYKADSILAGSRIGHEQAQKELVSQSGWVGAEVTLYNPGSFLDFVISDISLYVNVSATVPVKIYNVITGQLLATVNVVTTAGQPSTHFEKVVIPAMRGNLHLWLGYDGTAIDSYKTLVHNACATCSGTVFTHRFVRASGAGIASPFLENSLTPLSHTAGISLNYSVNCNHKDWLCTHRNILGIPFLYKTGIEICNHALLSSINQRVMAITTVNLEVMKEKKAYYEEQYEKEMNNLMRNMAVPQDRNCFICDQQVRSVTLLP